MHSWQGGPYQSFLKMNDSVVLIRNTRKLADCFVSLICGIKTNNFLSLHLEETNNRRNRSEDKYEMIVQNFSFHLQRYLDI